MQRNLKKTPEANESNQKNAHKDFLLSLYLFHEFSDAAIDLLLERAKIKNHNKDKLLFLTGDKAEYFYIIIDGWIKLYRETQDGHESIISVLTHGDIFGKVAIVKNSHFPYTAEAVSDSTIIQIPTAFVREMAEDNEHFDHFIAKFLEAQIHETHQQYLEAEHLTQMTSAQRVGCFLLKMCGNQLEGTAKLQFPYEKSLVAGKLGMTAETFSRSLNQLSSIGVETINAEVTIHNIEQLRAHICGHCSAMNKECNFSRDEG